MMSDSGLFVFSQAIRFNPEVEEWLWGEPAALYSLARQWFEQCRQLGDDVQELIHDGYPVACVGQAAFAYVNVFTRHVNVGFFTGAFLPDPANLLQGSGKRMRHVKLLADSQPDTDALQHLLNAAYDDVKARANEP